MLKGMKLYQIALFALFASVPALADTQFRINRMTRDDVPAGKGQCDIRLQVDDQVEVTVRRDAVSIRTLSGRDARDDGSECNQPLPDRDIHGFLFEVKDSRNEIRLTEEPGSRNGFAAIVRIRDTDGGYGRYHFRLTWALAGITSGPGPGGFANDRPGPGGFAWNNAIHFSGKGRGESSLSGAGSQPLRDASVDIDRGGRIQVSFRTEKGRPLSFTGTVTSRDGDTIKADVGGDERMLRLRGPMYITVDQGQNVYRISLDASNGRDNLRLNWDRR